MRSGTWPILLFAVAVAVVTSRSPKLHLLTCWQRRVSSAGVLNWPAGRGALPLQQASANEDARSAEDWRDVRAALVGAVSSEKANDRGWVHTLPVVEVGTVLLAASAVFALRRPELHKAVALVLKHQPTENSVAVLLNRADPTHRGPGFGGLGSKRWRILLRREASDEDSHGLHIIRDVLAVEGDKLLDTDDVEIFVDVLGELSWQPGALQEEVDTGLWRAAAADSAALVDALHQGSNKDACHQSCDGHGVACWERLSSRLASANGVINTAPLLGSSMPSMAACAPSSTMDKTGDELLQHWAQQRWTGMQEVRPQLFPPAQAQGLPSVVAGSLVLTGADAFSTGDQQFLHKSLLLVLDVNDSELLALCLNRPVPSMKRPGHARRPPLSNRANVRGLSASAARPHLHPGLQKRSSEAPSNIAVSFGGPKDWSRWTCLVACGATAPAALHAEPVGDSGLWRCFSAADTWRLLRTGGAGGCNPAAFFARGLVRLGRMELEMLQFRGEAGTVTEWTPELRDVAAACTTYRGPAGRGVRVGLYGDHHGFGLWERAVSHAFHGGDDHAATAARGVVGDKALREWVLARLGPDGGIGDPGS